MPMASAVLIVSCTASPPSATTTVSPSPAFSLSDSAASIAYSSYGFGTDLTPVSSMPVPLPAMTIFAVVSGTRRRQTAIFMSMQFPVQCSNAPVAGGSRLLVVQHQVSRHAGSGRQPPTPSVLECRQSRDLLAENQRVHVVGAFVGIHRFEISQVPHRMVFHQDAVGAQ